MNIDSLKRDVLNAIAPIKEAPKSWHLGDFVYNAKRTNTNAGRQLSEYYLVYFLLVDLLDFAVVPSWALDKTAWSVCIDFLERPYFIEHRKFGLGVFAQDLSVDEEPSKEIVRLIRRGVDIAKPYFISRATAAVNTSELNVTNKSDTLYERYQFFVNLYKSKIDEVTSLKGKRIVTQMEEGHQRIDYPVYDASREARWLALAVIESFFSWTEHVFVHLAILQGKCITGDAVASLSVSEWSEKFKKALDLADTTTKAYYDDLVSIRRQVRNYVAHGSFGKQGEAFQFHSGAGAVPVRLFDSKRGPSYRFGHGTEYVDEKAIDLIHNFIRYMWSGKLAPARIYLQDHGLPLYLTMAKDGAYDCAMKSARAMSELADRLTYQIDMHANMDY